MKKLENIIMRVSNKYHRECRSAVNKYHRAVNKYNKCPACNSEKYSLCNECCSKTNAIENLYICLCCSSIFRFPKVDVNKIQKEGSTSFYKIDDNMLNRIQIYIN